MIYNVCLLAIRLGDVPLELVLISLIGVLIGAVVTGVLVIKKKVQADDNLPAQEVIGRVIEVTTEEDGVAGIMTFTVEWIVVEDEKGNRKKYRNIRKNQIYISAGDSCRMTVRGNTIYEYSRVKER